MRGIVEFREGLEIFGGGSGRWSLFFFFFSSTGGGLNTINLLNGKLVSYPLNHA